MALPSPSECWKCSAISPERPFCPHCGSLKAAPEGLSFFDLLNVPLALEIDGELLRAHFYELSRQVHPDKFSGLAPQDAMHAARWSTLVNRGYQTLRDDTKRTHYLLELFDVPVPKEAPIPLDLAETYFDMQDAAPEGLGDFKRDLKNMLEEARGKWKSLAQEFAGDGDRRKILESLRAQLIKEKYLQSMLADLEKKLGS